MSPTPQPTKSYVGIHPTGRRFYVQSKTGRPLAFAVFVRDMRLPTVKWQRTDVVEDRPYKDERHRVNGSYVPYPGEMPSRVKAEEQARWYREVIGNHEAVVVELRPAAGSSSLVPLATVGEVAGTARAAEGGSSLVAGRDAYVPCAHPEHRLGTRGGLRPHQRVCMTCGEVVLIHGRHL